MSCHCYALFCQCYSEFCTIFRVILRFFEYHLFFSTIRLFELYSLCFLFMLSRILESRIFEYFLFYSKNVCSYSPMFLFF